MIRDTLFLTVVFLTNIIQGITGFAGTVLAMPPGIFLQGINTAKSVLNILGLLSSIWIVAISYKNINWKEFSKIIIFMMIGMIGGIYLYSMLPLDFLLKVYAMFIILIALKGILVKKSYDLQEWILVVIIIMAGIIHGMFVSGGPLIMIYVMKKMHDKTSFRATIAMIWIVLNSYLAFTHYSQGLFTPGNVKMLLFSVPPLLIGMMAGNILHHKMSQQSFLKLSYVLLSISGLALIIK